MSRDCCYYTLLALLCIGCIEKVTAQGLNKFYTGPGNVTGFCPIGQCSVGSAGCKPYQWVSGCGFNLTGVCNNFTGVQPGYYFSGSSGSGLSNSEGVQSPCTSCPASQYNSGCSASSAGSCVTCNPAILPANNYWTIPPNATVTCPYAAQLVAPPGFKTVGQNSTYAGYLVGCPALGAGLYYPPPVLPTEVCTSASFTVCPAGQKLVGYSQTAAGTCQACPATANGSYYAPNAAFDAVCVASSCVDTDCAIGQYKNGCTGTNSGTCAPCTTANSSQVYSTKGGWSNSCQVAGCVKTCPIGQYIVGCGTAGMVSSGLTCGNCVNSVANVNFYVDQGAYLSNSCPTTACVPCTNGNYLVGCGNLSSGVCTVCTNTVY